MQEEEEERKKKEAENTAGWVEKGGSSPILDDQKPMSTLDPSALNEAEIAYKKEEEISCDNEVQLDFESQN